MTTHDKVKGRELLAERKFLQFEKQRLQEKVKQIKTLVQMHDSKLPWEIMKQLQQEEVEENSEEYYQLQAKINELTMKIEKQSVLLGGLENYAPVDL